MPDAAGRIAELLSVPLEQLLTALGRGIGEAQAALDRHSVEIQRLIDEDPVLGPIGVAATWYQIPQTQLELKLAVAMEQPAPSVDDDGAPQAFVGGALRPSLPRLWAQPVNARYANQFGYDVTAASTVSLTVVPVPPPTLTSLPPVRTPEEVLQAVADELLTNSAGERRGRVSVNFNAAVRTWYVLQTDSEAGIPQRLKLLRVDDETGAVTTNSGGET